MRAQREIAELMRAQHGVLLRRDHPGLTRTLTRMAAQHQLVAVLPGVFVAAGTEREPLTRIRAMACWEPSAIFTGTAAAWLSYWPEIRPDCVGVTLRHDRRAQPGYRFDRRRIPLELVTEQRGLRFTNPSLTALDLSDLEHTDAIDTALRTRAATLESLQEAFRLSPGRAGNRERRRVLLDSRDAPWSRAERLAHRLLREAGLTGWSANYPVNDLGWLYYLDIAFPRLRLAVEIDGRLHEDDGDQFESDRWRQNALVMQGWRVLRFTWSMLTEHPEQFVQAVRRTLRDQKYALA